VNEALAVTSTEIGRHFHGNVLDMILGSGPMVQFVLLLLLFFSVVSWAIILMKYRVIKRSRKENDMFLDRYMKINKLSEVFPESKKFRNSQIAEVFRAGYTELVKIAGIRREALSDADSEISLEMRGLDNVERALNRACDSETTKLESSLGFLATAGSSCPFIGLFRNRLGYHECFQGNWGKGVRHTGGSRSGNIGSSDSHRCRTGSGYTRSHLLQLLHQSGKNHDGGNRQFFFGISQHSRKVSHKEHPQMRYSRNRRNTATRPISDINVTPLVDVILVLLIIFMVTAPMLQMGIDVNLPRVKAKTVDVGEEKLILTINNKEEIFINKYKTSITGLQAKLENIFSSRIDREIFIARR